VSEPREDALVAELRSLADWLEVPEPRDQRAAVRARLLAPARPVGRRLRRWLAGLVAAAVCTVVAVPPARATVTDAVAGLLRLAGVEVRREPVPPGVPATAQPVPSTRSTDLTQARRLARFTVRVPTELGEPDRVTLSDPDEGGAPRVVTLLYDGGKVRLDQFDGTLDTSFAKTAPDARWSQVDDRPAIWLPGPHAVTYVDRAGVPRTETARLAGPTLIWAGQEAAYRLEGIDTLARARQIAASLE